MNNFTALNQILHFKIIYTTAHLFPLLPTTKPLGTLLLLQNSHLTFKYKMNTWSILTDWWIKGISCVAANLLENPAFPSGIPKFKGSLFLITIWKHSRKQQKVTTDKALQIPWWSCTFKNTSSYTALHLRCAEIWEAKQPHKLKNRRG